MQFDTEVGKIFRLDDNSSLVLTDHTLRRNKLESSCYYANYSDNLRRKDDMSSAYNDAHKTGFLLSYVQINGNGEEVTPAVQLEFFYTHYFP
jgi:hypothetical protein